MILTHAENEFRALCSFYEKDIPKAAGFRWNPARKVWFTGDADRARRLQEYADSSARRALEGSNSARTEAIAASKAADADIDIPAPPGLAYLPYQRAGIAYALKRPAVLIADEMGLGKTIQAIGVVNALGADAGVAGVASDRHRVRRVLVVCPATLRLNWRAEWTRWHVGNIKPVVVTDTWWSGLDVEATDLFETKAFAIIMSYEGVLKWKAKLLSLPIDVAIFDECHALKNGKAKRTKAVFGAYAANDKRHIPPLVAKRRIFLTGTPIVNRPAELQPLLHSIDPNGLGSPDFHRRYVVPIVPSPERMAQLRRQRIDVGRWMKRQEDDRMAELHERLRERVMVRRLKADVLTELPAKRRQMILVNVEGAAAILAREQEALWTQAEAFQRVRDEVAGLDHQAAVQRLRAFRGAAMAEISRIRHETAVKKIPAVIDHMFALLDETPKLVLFAHHHDVIDAIAEALPNAHVKLDGRDTPEARQQAVTRFQGDREVRLFVGSIRAAGLGITLTAAAVVAFAELDWTPAGMVQAEDRCHRIGQRDSVLVQHLVLDGSIDQRMSRILIDKADVIGAVLDGKIPEGAQTSILDDVLKCS